VRPHAGPFPRVFRDHFVHNQVSKLTSCGFMSFNICCRSHGGSSASNESVRARRSAVGGVSPFPTGVGSGADDVLMAIFQLMRYVVYQIAIGYSNEGKKTLSSLKRLGMT
jgi:hypothetical protein